MSHRRAAARAGLFLTALASASRADLAHDADTLVAKYEAEGATARLRPTRFVLGGATLPLPLPDWAERDPRPCTTFVALGAPSTVFVLRVTSVKPESSADDVVPSFGGAAAMERCGKERTDLDGLVLEMRSPHGVIESLVVSSAAKLPTVARLLPDRDPGPRSFLERPGPPPAPAPADERATRFEEALAREGMTDVKRRMVPASASGSGRALLDFEVGCHRLAVMPAPAPGDTAVRDLDAELSSISGETADIDRSETPDATLTACTGERRPFVLSFAGGPPGGPILIVSGTSPLPPGIPASFGESARARLARALLARRGPAVAAQPVRATMGVQGTTVVPLDVTPGRCYLAGLTPLEGTPKLLSLHFQSGKTAAEAHSTDPRDALVLVACVGAEHRASLEVLGQGPSLVWGVALWPIASLPLGEATP